jgi:hypothetical protein
MISGTPLYTGIDDLHGELSFLRVFPWAQDDKVPFFRFPHLVNSRVLPPSQYISPI